MQGQDSKSSDDFVTSQTICPFHGLTMTVCINRPDIEPLGVCSIAKTNTDMHALHISPVEEICVF